MYLWELGNQVVGHLHGIVEEVKYLCELLFIGSQHFWDSNNYVLDLISLKAKLDFTHLWKIFFKNCLLSTSNLLNVS